MLGGKNKYRPLGYTIVEVMVVLAVSGVIFLIAVNFINGRQGRTAFNEGANDMASDVQNVIEQVKSGKYSDAELSCLFNGAQVQIPDPTGSPQEQGTNSTCVFLGKVMYFGYDSPNPDSSYKVFTLAGGRLDSNGNAFASPNAAFATIVGNPDLTIKTVTPQNLTVMKVTATKLSNGRSVSTHGIGFFQSPALDSGGQQTGGAETINLYYTTSTPAADDIGTIRTAAASAADICLSDGTRYADILLGAPDATGSASGNDLVVNLKMDDTTPC